MVGMANSDFGRDIGLVHKAIVTGRKVGADRKFWTALADDEDLFRKVVAFIQSGFVAECIDLEVKDDSEYSLTEMIEAGEYDWVDRNITAQCSLSEEKRRYEPSLVLVRFNCEIMPDDAIAVMKKQGYGPAKIGALLALGKHHPDLPFLVVAPHSVRRSPGENYMPALWRGPHGRNLGYRYFDERYSPACRFLALPK